MSSVPRGGWCPGKHFEGAGSGVMSWVVDGVLYPVAGGGVTELSTYWLLANDTTHQQALQPLDHAIEVVIGHAAAARETQPTFEDPSGGSVDACWGGGEERL